MAAVTASSLAVAGCWGGCLVLMLCPVKKVEVGLSELPGTLGVQAAKHGASLALAPDNAAPGQHGACHRICSTLSHRTASMLDNCTCPHAVAPPTLTSLVMDAVPAKFSREPLLVLRYGTLAQLVLDGVAHAETSVSCLSDALQGCG